MLGLLLSECEFDLILMFIIHINPNFVCISDLAFKFHKNISWAFFATLSTYIVSIAVTPASYILCLIVFQIWCHRCTKHVPHWLQITLIISYSNDVHMNPGPHWLPK